MKNSRAGTGVAFAIIALLASMGRAQTVIDFDDLSHNTVVTSQYPIATFSAETGYENIAIAFSGPSEPMILCTRVINGGLGCDADTYIDFAAAVNDLTLQAVAVDDPGVVCRVVVYENGIQTAVVDIIGPMMPWGPIDLSGFSDVTRIEIIDINDQGGIGWDDFSFETDAIFIDGFETGGTSAWSASFP